MAFTKITSADLIDKGVTGLPDTPGYTTAQMQAKFDELSKDVIVPKFNALSDELDDTVRSSIAELNDVEITDLQDGQILKYFAESGKFMNIEESGGGGGGSANLQEVTQEEYDALSYAQKHDRTKAYFVRDAEIPPVTFATLGDVTLTNPSAKQTLEYDADLEKWKNVTNEKVLSSTLTAGSTTLTFTDAMITENALIDVYTSVYGVNPTAQSTSGTTLTITFEAQVSNMTVAIKIAKGA